MTYNVDPDLGAILSMLEYKMRQRSVTRAEVQAELNWKGTKLGRIFNRQMLVGLSLRTGLFEKAISAEKDLLAITGSPLEAAWAIEHENQLSAETWTEVEDVAPGANLEAVVFLLDLYLAHRPDVESHLQELRDRLHHIWSEEEGGDDVG